MEHLQVIRDKIGRFREDSVGIQELNLQFRSALRNGTVSPSCSRTEE